MLLSKILNVIVVFYTFYNQYEENNNVKYQIINRFLI
jgi:hypothetical protein